MERKVMFKGIIPPVPTIFDETGNLDRDGMGNLIDFLIDSKVDALFFLGTSGEFSQMSIEERKEVAAFAVNYVAGRVPVLVGTGSPSTRDVIDLSLHSQQLGADGVVVINPYYWKLSEENLFEHYGEIAKKVDLPILLYNFSQLTGQELSPEFVLRLVEEHPNIVGIKETVDEAGHIREMILKVKKRHPHFSVLAGFDDHLLSTLCLGGDGAICACVNFAPQLFTGVLQAFHEDDLKKALQLHQQIAYLPLLYKIATPFVGVVKECIKRVGIEVSSHVLPPAKPLNQEQMKQIEEALSQAGLLDTVKE